MLALTQCSANQTKADEHERPVIGAGIADADAKPNRTSSRPSKSPDEPTLTDVIDWPKSVKPKKANPEPPGCATLICWEPSEIGPTDCIGPLQSAHDEPKGTYRSDKVESHRANEIEVKIARVKGVKNSSLDASEN